MNRRTDEILRRILNRKATTSDIFSFIQLLRVWFIQKGEEGKKLERRFIRDLNQTCLKWWDAYNKLCENREDDPSYKGLIADISIYDELSEDKEDEQNEENESDHK